MNLLYPLKDVYITQKFGANPQVYAQFGLKGHNGTDYRAKYVDVFAAQYGVATRFNTGNQGYGKHIKIAHPDGSCTIYGHLSEYSIESGQTVKMGQKIGVSGNTGFSTAPHLHFGLRPINANPNNGYAGYVDNAALMTSQITNPDNPMKLEDLKLSDLTENQFNKLHDLANVQYPGWTRDVYNKKNNAFSEWKAAYGTDTSVHKILNIMWEEHPSLVPTRAKAQEALQGEDAKKLEEVRKIVEL